jgi:serine/threonine-protein kinase
MSLPRVVADRFELTDRIGRGAIGDVWAAVDLRTRANVAVKVLQGWAADEPEIVARFEREAHLLRRLRSPFICSLVDSGHLESGAPFLVLERLLGETLEELLTREGYLAMEEVVQIADEILQALVVAHGAGVVHRDLSPSNVFIHRPHDDVVLTKLLDFGVAKAEGGTAKTGNSATMGSLSYVAPEQLGDSARAGPQADLYAVGTVVFRALSGRMPYGDAKGVSLVVLKRENDPPNIDEATGERWPAALRVFLVKMMARTPARRYASAEEALASLREAVRGRVT